MTLWQKAQALRGALQPAYWQALIVVSLLYFARFDASFITLRARTVSMIRFITSVNRHHACLSVHASCLPVLVIMYVLVSNGLSVRAAGGCNRHQLPLPM